MTEIKLTLDDPGMAARQLRHAANHWNDGAPKPNPVGDLLLAVADSIEEQVKPAIEEPTEFGSIVRAGVDGLSDRVLWARGGGHYWFSETIRRADFEDLYQPEVLRVGIGGSPSLQQIRDLLHRSPSGHLTNEEVAAAYKELRKGMSALLEAL